MDCRAVVVMALALCASCVSAHSSGRFLLQTNVTAPNVTGTTLAGFTFTANVGSERWLRARRAPPAPLPAGACLWWPDPHLPDGHACMHDGPGL